MAIGKRILKAAALPCVVATLGGTQLAQAANVYWDINSTTAGSGHLSGNTSWGSGSQFWNTDPDGGAGTFSSISTTTNDIFFSAGTDAGSSAGGAYSVGLSGARTVNSVTFEDGAITIGGSPAFTVTSGNVTVNPGITATANGSSSTTSGFAGTANYTKLGTGTLILTNNHNYTGTTTVAAGAMYVNGNHLGGATGVGNYTVNSGATLGGTGTITFAAGNGVTVNGTLAPGSPATAIESLNLGVNGNAVLAGNANFDLDLTTDLSDELIVGDALTYGGVLNVTLTGSDPADATYDLFDFASQSGTFATINVTGLGEGQTADFNYGTGELSIIAVPEPASVALVGVGALLMLRRRRRA
jgi:autotransporter-associated beta strand protein